MADAELIREAYARFGAAYYYSECLHRELCNAYAIAPFQTREVVTGPRIEERLAESFGMTLGQLVDSIAPWSPKELQKALAEAVKRRNFLAHHFWFDRAHRLFSDSDLSQLIEELEEHRAFFEAVDERTAAHFHPQQASLGVTDDAVAAAALAMDSASERAPLLNQRRLRKQETIVKIWDAPTPEGSTLIFETDDGVLWQLCDVGLGWTRHSERDVDWKLNSSLMPHLPTRLNPRPGVDGAWSYELRLKDDTLLSVRLSNKQCRTFVWTIRRNTGTEPNTVLKPTARTDEL